jgi:hypothetical protein
MEVVMDRLNYFEPYQSKPSNHEDQLTRAFLVLCRYVPMVQALFIDLVRKELAERSPDAPDPLSLAGNSAELQTQTGAISESQGKVLSILMTDRKTTVEEDVRWSDRSPRYDGYMVWDDWVIIVENKPRQANVWREQLNPSRNGLPPDHELEVHPVGVALAWKDVISGLTSLLERGAISGAEARMADDFRDFVARRFAFLNPFDRLSLCKGHRYLIRKRLEDLLQSIGDVADARGAPLRLRGGPTKYAYLEPSHSEDPSGPTHIVLSLYPADTVGQARAFYRRIDAGRLGELEDTGWSIRTNLHFTFMSTGVCGTEMRPEWREYVAYWAENQGEIGQEVVRADGSAEERAPALTEKLRKWRSLGFIADSEIAEIDQRFTRTNRSHINIAPGLRLEFRWSLQEAARLDDEGAFRAEIERRLEEALSVWGGGIAAEVVKEEAA